MNPLTNRFCLAILVAASLIIAACSGVPNSGGGNGGGGGTGPLFYRGDCFRSHGHRIGTSR